MGWVYQDHDPWKSDLSAIKEPVNRSLILAGFVSIIIALLLVIRALSISEYSPNLASTLVYYMGLIILLFSIVLILLGRRYSDESTIIKDPVRRKHKVERIIRQSLLLLIVGLALSVFSFIITDFMNVLDGTVDGNESTNVENRPPIAVIDTINTNENEPIRFNVLTNDEDTENGNNLTVKEFTTPPNNNFYIYPNGTGEYIPTRNFTGMKPTITLFLIHRQHAVLPK